MAKIKDLSGKTNRYGEFLEEYLRIVPPDMFIMFHDFLFNENLSLEKKLENFEKVKDEINKLRYLFKQRTIELNKKAEEEGYKNYLEATISWNGIPREKYKTFLNSINRFVKLVMEDEIPVKALMEKEKNWNAFNTPYPLGNRILDLEFKSPYETLNIMSTYDGRITKYKDRIKIVDDEEVFYTKASYDIDKGIVEIYLRVDQKNDFYKTLDFVHSIGFGLDALELIDKGIDPVTISKYDSKYKTIKYGFQFIKRQLSERHQKVLRYNLLSVIAATLFEIDIFINSKQDYDKAYAKAIDKCYPMTSQVDNPFYVYYRRFILRPMDELLPVMIEVELYLKEARLEKDN